MIKYVKPVENVSTAACSHWTWLSGRLDFAQVKIPPLVHRPMLASANLKCSLVTYLGLPFGA